MTAVSPASGTSVASSLTAGVAALVSDRPPCPPCHCDPHLAWQKLGWAPELVRKPGPGLSVSPAPQPAAVTPRGLCGMTVSR